MSETTGALNLGQRRELVPVATQGIGPEFGKAASPDSRTGSAISRTMADGEKLNYERRVAGSGLGALAGKWIRRGGRP